MSTTGMHAPNGGPLPRREAPRHGWRACLVAGLAAVVAGLACLAWPGHSVDVLVRIIALALLVQAAGSVVTGLRSRALPGSGMMILSGAVLALVAAFMAWHPGLTGGLIVMAAGGLVLLAGLAAAWLGTVLRGRSGGARWLQGAGLLGALVGLVLLVHPRFGATVTGILIGLAMILLGGVLVAVALTLRRVLADGPAATVQPGTMTARRRTGRTRGQGRGHREEQAEEVIIEGDLVEE